jgi:hypothetical protein
MGEGKTAAVPSPEACAAAEGGTGVPLVVALRVPGFLFIFGFRGLNMYVAPAQSCVFSSFLSTKTRLSIV